MELIGFPRSLPDLRIQGFLRRMANEIICRFEVHDPQNKIVGGLHPKSWSRNDLTRSDGLWKSTCFEMFWGMVGEPAYYELNLSPHSPSWNLYRFLEYRSPAPPEASDDFEIVSVVTTAQSIECRLQSRLISQLQTPPESRLPSGMQYQDLATMPFEANLCAVIKTATEIFYYSLQHGGDKPDFHRRADFLIKNLS